MKRLVSLVTLATLLVFIIGSTPAYAWGDGPEPEQEYKFQCMSADCKALERIADTQETMTAIHITMFVFTAAFLIAGTSYGIYTVEDRSNK